MFAVRAVLRSSYAPVLKPVTARLAQTGAAGYIHFSARCSSAKVAVVSQGAASAAYKL